MAYLVALVLVVIGGAAFYFFGNNQPTTETIDSVPVVENVESVPQAEPAVTDEPVLQEEVVTEETVVASDEKPLGDYTDGTYTTDVTYLTPKRDTYGMRVSLTLSQDIVTGATITYSDGAEKDPNAARFEAAYRAQVIGKDIDTINLSRVGGASLTTNAFNNAVSEIKSDARS